MDDYVILLPTCLVLLLFYVVYKSIIQDFKMNTNELPCRVYLFDNPVLDFSKLSERQSDSDVEYVRRDVVKVLIEGEADNAYGKGCEYTRERIKEALLSDVLPCFMHGGEADEVVAKLEEVLGGTKNAPPSQAMHP